MTKRLPILFLATLVAACSGGSTSTQNASTGASIPLPLASGTGSVLVTIAIPSKTTSSANRSTRYVSPSALSASIALYPVVASVISPTPSTTSNQDLSATTPGCLAGPPVTCSIQMSSAPGLFAFGVKLYAGLSQSGPIVSQLDPSAATERNIVPGVANTILGLTLSGIASTITLSPASSSLIGGVSNTIPLTVIARDYGNNIIIGSAPYETPITLTSSDPAISFSPATVTAPTTSVTLNYNGNSTPTTDSIFATAGAATGSGSLTFTPAALNVSCSGSCSGIANGAAPYAFSVTESGLTGSVTVSASGTGCVLDSSSVAVSGGSGNVNLYPDPKGGTCSVLATDGYAQTKTGSILFNPAAYPSTVVCVNPALKPVDPNGGFLYMFGCASNTSVRWGSYTYVPLQSNQNPISFQVAAYANTTQAALFQTTVSGDRYITAAGTSGTSTYVTFTGQSTTTNVDLAPFTP